MDAEIRVCVITVVAVLCSAQGSTLEGVLQGVASELTNIASVARDQVTNTRTAIRTTVTDIADKTVDPLLKVIASGIQRTATGRARDEEHRMSAEEFHRGIAIGEDVVCMARKRPGPWEVTEVEECISEGRSIIMNSLEKCLKKARTARNAGTEEGDPAASRESKGDDQAHEGAESGNAGTEGGDPAASRESKGDDQAHAVAVSANENDVEVVVVIKMSNGKVGDESDVTESGGEPEFQDVTESGGEPEVQGVTESGGEPEDQDMIESGGEPEDQDVRESGGEPEDQDVRESGGEPQDQDVRITDCGHEEEETATEERERKLEVMSETPDEGQMNVTLIKSDEILPVFTGAPEGSERTKRSGRGTRRHRRRG